MNNANQILLIVLFALAGCRGPVSLVIPEPDLGGQSAAIAACCWVSMVEVSDAEPDAGDQCVNCNGTGQVGDGRIMKTCQVCGGSGKKKTEPKAAAVERASEPPAAPPPYRQTFDPPPADSGDSVPLPVNPDHDKPPALKRVTIYKSKDCNPCEEWLTAQRHLWEAAGFEVVEADSPPEFDTPWFKIQDGSFERDTNHTLTWDRYAKWAASQAKGSK